MITREVESVNVKTGHKKIFESASDAAAFFEINPAYLRRIIKNEKVFRGVILRFTGNTGRQTLGGKSYGIIAVSQMDGTNKNPLIYKSGADAAKDFGVHYSQIIYAAKKGASFMGYKFSFKETVE